MSWWFNELINAAQGKDYICNYIHARKMVSFGLLRRVALVRTDVSEEPGASFIRVTKISELGTT
jgi:hypothetical protein